jgi:hypothetical protein
MPAADVHSIEGAALLSAIDVDGVTLDQKELEAAARSCLWI